MTLSSASLSTPALFPCTPVLIGTHTTLEALSPAHIPTLYDSIGQHSALWMQIHSGPFASLEDFTSYIHARIASAATTSPRWAIRLNSTNTAPTYIGLVGLDSIDLSNKTLEVGPVIYGAPLRRTRAGTEVLLLIGDLIFNQCNFRRWEWRCNALNAASRRAAERYGFVLEGVLRQHQIVRGLNRDTCVFAMLDGEWEVARRVWECWLDEMNFDVEGRMRKGMGEIREGMLAG